MHFPSPPKNNFLAPLGRFGRPQSRRIEFFGSFLAPPWILRDPKNHPKSIFNIKTFKNHVRAEHFFNTISKVAFGSLLGTILVHFGWISNEFWWILALFLIEIGCIFARTFPDHRSRLARNKSTENLKNMQITSEICTNWTQAKTQTSNIWSISCNLLNASSCNKRLAPNTFLESMLAVSCPCNP